LKSGIWDAANGRVVGLGKRKLKNWTKKACAGLALLGALVWMSPARVRADTATPQTSAGTAKKKSRTSSQKSTQKASAHAGQHRSTHHPATRRVSSRARRAAARRRRALLRPEPERIQEIQQALIQAGYLNAQPNGRWDDQTREAMRRYQADHGFPVTGLPEAKSLMKLGLGPHPLPADLDTGGGARPGGNTVSDTPAPADPQQTPP
jgi:peptidoglycan hydrolase-like protein with peptidoglycan-binding domain